MGSIESVCLIDHGIEGESLPELASPYVGILEGSGDDVISVKTLEPVRECPMPAS